MGERCLHVCKYSIAHHIELSLKDKSAFSRTTKCHDMPQKNAITKSPTSVDGPLGDTMMSMSAIPSTPGGGILDAQEEICQFSQTRLFKSRLISQIWKAIKGCCPVCWALRGEQVQTTLVTRKGEDGHQLYFTCKTKSEHRDTRITYKGWLNIKKEMKFTEYRYCWRCHCPQDEYLPECHPKTFHGDCGWSDMLAHIVWVIRQQNHVWEAAVGELKIPSKVAYGKLEDYKGFAKWLSMENNLSCFHNGLELLLWFVKKYYAWYIGY